MSPVNWLLAGSSFQVPTQGLSAARTGAEVRASRASVASIFLMGFPSLWDWGPGDSDVVIEVD